MEKYVIYKLLTNDGITLPGVFIIDKEGIIQYYTVNNLLCGRSVNELLRVLQSIQYVKENLGQACPVDWNEIRETKHYILIR